MGGNIQIVKYCLHKYKRRQLPVNLNWDLTLQILWKTESKKILDTGHAENFLKTDRKKILDTAMQKIF